MVFASLVGRVVILTGLQIWSGVCLINKTSTDKRWDKKFNWGGGGEDIPHGDL